LGNGRTREIFRGYLSGMKRLLSGSPAASAWSTGLEFNCTPLEREHASSMSQPTLQHSVKASRLTLSARLRQRESGKITKKKRHIHIVATARAAIPNNAGPLKENPRLSMPLPPLPVTLLHQGRICGWFFSSRQLPIAWHA